MLDVAAGYNFRVPSEVPSEKLRPILAVQLPSIATLDTSGVTMGSYVLQAVRQIMLWAAQLGDKVPLVINFSYGFTAGPKDGTHPLELALSELVSYRDKRQHARDVSGPAGRQQPSDPHDRENDLQGGASESLDWIILPDDPTPNFLEIWLDALPEPRRRRRSRSRSRRPGDLPRNAVRLRDGKISELRIDDNTIAACRTTS